MNTTTENREIIFISGRFRSGTSLLWNIFHNLPQYCAWYEPLHPNLLAHIKYVEPKQDHMGIDDYWQNYRRLENLKGYYSSSFGQDRIYLEKHEKWDELRQYIQFLIDSSANKIPVLQFNRMDLRLDWLKNTFPQAKILHISREPYDLWLSSRKHLEKDEDKQNESHPDAYDLLQWSANLSTYFPMLSPQKGRHSYFRHYFIWKLAQQCAQSSADLKIKHREDILNPTIGVKPIAKFLAWDKESQQLAQSLIHTPQDYETKKESLIDEIEDKVDALFMDLGLQTLYPSSMLSCIIEENKSQWEKHSYDNQLVISELLGALKFQKNELTALLNR